MSNLGFAFVTFMMPEHAVTAFSELDGSTFKGRLLHLLPAKPKEETEEGTGGPGSEFKKQKDAKLKASAGNSYNWNSLFLRVNAVADVMEEQYGVDKAQVMMDDDDKISELDLHSIGSSPKFSIGTPPKKYNDFQNDPLLVKGHGLRLATP